MVSISDRMELITEEREGMAAETQVLSPVPELMERSRSSTPGSDSNNATPDASSSTVTTDSNTQGHINTSSVCRKGPTSQMDKEEKGFMDHIFSLTKEYSQEIQEMGRQLRLERKRNAKLEMELNHYRLECDNYKLSWMMDQAEVEELQTKLQEMDNYKDEIKNIEAQMNCMEDENKKLKKSLSQVHFDNKALRKIMVNMTDMRVDAEIRGALVPNMPPCSVEGRRRSGRRRQHTRKSHCAKTTQLPPVTENNRIAGSPQQTTASSRVTTRDFLARRASMGNICPQPPRRDLSSRRQLQSGVPLSSAMSAESVPRGRARHLSSWK
ncbi:uncharacterized protein LOC124120556 [Haliotis rufescens]|uniref:uncharacterized protein LOC124120556 n=1 Tax=Haliotis rufescens TaxID=6454 RepID=UPI001EB07E01|nr:uncharacterized protein LOC124120556 [Haliotis rufescens]